MAPTMRSEAEAPPPLAERLELAERERDKALLELGHARAELDALRRALESRGEPEPPLYPNTAAPGLAPPLRYVLVDALHGAVKGVIKQLSQRWRSFGSHEC